MRARLPPAFEQKLLDEKLTVVVGKVNIDDHFDTGEVGSCNFTSYGLARNPTVPCPWHAIGAVVRCAPAKWVGPLPGRGRDVLGFGAGQAIMGDGYRLANSGSAWAGTLFELC